MKNIIELLAEFSCGLADYRTIEELLFSNTISDELLKDIPDYVLDSLVADNELNIFGHLYIRDELRKWGYDNKKTESEFLKAKCKAFDHVKSGIISEFKNVKLGSGITLAQANAIDSYESDENQRKARDTDKNISWQEYPSKSMEQFTALQYLDAEGFVFYIPAYMCWCINNILDYPFSNIAAETIGAFDPELSRFKLRMDALSDSQINVVEDFLWLLAIHSVIYRETCISGLKALGPLAFDSKKLVQTRS